MKRLSSAVVLTLAAGAAVLGTAGGAVAHDGHRHRHGATAEAVAIGSPGVLSGNIIQVPVDVPINICGNSVDVIGLLNPAIGNTCVNGFDHHRRHHHRHGGGEGFRHGGGERGERGGERGERGGERGEGRGEGRGYERGNDRGDDHGRNNGW